MQRFSFSLTKSCLFLLLTLLLHFAACQCGRRLCDEVTGSCICPPQTVRPACDVCEAQTFSYHPLLGCEGCDCSPSGITDGTRPECDRITGQCRCVEQDTCCKQGLVESYINRNFFQCKEANRIFLSLSSMCSLFIRQHLFSLIGMLQYYYNKY